MRIGLLVDGVPDETLLAGIGRGDEEITVAFVRRFQRRVYGVALSVLGDPSLSEDVAQEVFERAWRQADRYDSARGSVTTWMLAIARNLAIDKARARRAVPIGPDDALLCLLTSTESTEGSAIAGLAAEHLRRALREIPLEQARAVVMAGIAGMSASRIAEQEGIPLGTAKSRIRIAMPKLRAALSGEELPA